MEKETKSQNEKKKNGNKSISVLASFYFLRWILCIQLLMVLFKQNGYFMTLFFFLVNYIL